MFILFCHGFLCSTERWQLQLSISSYNDSDVGEFYLILMFADKFHSRDLIRYGLMPASNSDKTIFSFYYLVIIFTETTTIF